MIYKILIAFTVLLVVIVTFFFIQFEKYDDVNSKKAIFILNFESDKMFLNNFDYLYSISDKGIKGNIVIKN